jgi:uncharacterized protein YciI
MFKKLFPLVTIFLVLLSSVSVQAQKNEGLFFVFLNSNPEKPQISDAEKERLQAAHMANLDQLSREGKLLAAGPFDGGGGLLILDAENMEAAKAMVDTDPAVQAHRFKAEILPFRVSGNDLCGAKEPYEMVTYQFVRYTSNPDYFEDFDDMTRANRIFLSDLNNNNDYVVAYGSFSDYNDGILLLDVTTVEEAADIAKEHPSVKAGQLFYEVKSLWIAKGTFCKP